MGAQRGPYGLNNNSQSVEHISKATPTGQKKATKTIRTNIQEGQANAPWKRVRFKRGLGTKPANRAIKSSGSSTT
jgi:hypothetical protein